MTKGVIIFGTLLTPFLFPFWGVIVYAVGATFFSPLVPLAIGVLLDTLYYTPHAFLFPLYSVIGLSSTFVASLVRRFVQTSIIRG